MATLYISEYAELPVGPAGRVGQMPSEPPLVDQTVAIAAGSAQSAAFNAKTRFVRLHTDAICSVLFGSSPTAAATNGRMAANQTEYRDVSRLPGGKVAVITNT